MRHQPMVKPGARTDEMVSTMDLPPKPLKVTDINPNGSFQSLLLVRKTKRRRGATVMDKMTTTVVCNNTVY